MANQINKALAKKAINLSYENQVALMHTTGRYLGTSNVKGGIKDTININFSKFLLSTNALHYKTLDDAWIDFVRNYK